MKVCPREKLRMVVHLTVHCVRLEILWLVPYGCPASLHVPAMTWDEGYPSPFLRALHADLARLLRLLKKMPLDGAKVIQTLVLLMCQWASIMITCFLLIWSYLLPAWGY